MDEASRLGALIQENEALLKKVREGVGEIVTHQSEPERERAISFLSRLLEVSQRSLSSAVDIVDEIT